ncbi:MAG: tetratricopeptide repeat protein [Deltaproteobacteria bacterium]|nr:tetratricopeptide repeat protein [Deltaproteobacteria bacterium]
MRRSAAAAAAAAAAVAVRPVVWAVAVGCAVVCAALPRASADEPDDPAHDPAQRAAHLAAAEALAKDAKSSPDRQKHFACGQAYVDVYNREPEAADNDQVLWAAVTCFTDGGWIAPAIISLNVLGRYYPSSKLAPLALRKHAGLLVEVALFEKAADKLEEYAAKFAAESDAPAALIDAAHLRRGLGDGAKVIADAERFGKLYGAKRPADAAALALLAIDAHEERGDADAAVRGLRAYLAVSRDAVGADRHAIARARLAELLWKKSCPGKTADRLCATVVRERAAPLRGKPAVAKASVAARTCGTAAGGALTAVARTPTLASEALAEIRALGAAGSLDALVPAPPAGDPAAKDARLAALRGAYARARLVEADAELEAFLAMSFPADLDFNPRDRAVRERSLRLFNGWVTARNAKGQAAQRLYEGVLALRDGASTIAAAARLGQLMQGFADTLASAPIPRDVRSGEFAADKVEAFCDKMTELAEPLAERATQAFTMCLERAATLGLASSPWRAVCARELAQQTPHAWYATEELLPAASPRLPILLEPVQEVAGHDAALAEFRRLEGAWKEPDCRRVAKAFEGASARGGAASSYMAGLAYHRCGLAGDAERAYRAALDLDPSHAAARSNLAALAYGAGRAGEARDGWSKALQANGKLLGARVGTAAVALAEMVEKGERDPGWAKLDDDARYQLATALTVDDARDPRLLGWMALAWTEAARRVPARHGLARAVLDRAGPAAAASVPYQLALGASLLGRGDPVRAHDAFKKAASLEPANLDAAIGRALALVRAGGRNDEARDALAAVKATGPRVYDAQLVLGVAHARLRKYDEAEAAYAAAVKTDGNRPEAHFNLGLVHIGRGQHAADAAAAKLAFGRARDAFRAAADRAGVRADVKALALAEATIAERAFAAADAPVKKP